MSYVKNTWATGDVVTAVKLNNIENGVETLDTTKSVVSGVSEGDNWSSLTINGTTKNLNNSEGKVWKEITLSGQDIITLASGGQIVKSIDPLDPTKVYDPANFKNDYFTVKVEQKGVNGGNLVYPGTENWGWNSAGWFYLLTTADIGGGESSELITHFKYSSSQSAWGNLRLASNKYIYMYDNNGTQWASDTTAMKAWLAEQYAAGTPVTVYYPLATPTETTIEVPTISTSAGTNTIQTQTDIAPSAVSWTYRKKYKV